MKIDNPWHCYIIDRLYNEYITALFLSIHFFIIWSFVFCLFRPQALLLSSPGWNNLSYSFFFLQMHCPTINTDKSIKTVICAVHKFHQLSVA